MSKETKKTALSAPKAGARGSEKKVLRVPLHSVVHFVRMLHDEKQAAKFVKGARDSNAVVTLHPETVDFVKGFIASNQLHNSMAAKVVDPCPNDPFECHFRD